MALLLNVRELAKSYGSTELFRDISFTLSDGDRLGLIGPNGSGKSTLLEILAGRREPDSGEVALRKGTRLSHVAQDPRFPAGATVRTVIRQAMERAAVPPAERARREAEMLGRAGFEDFDAPAEVLSGGWQKRLAIAEALVQDPAILLLDEPTNHLDLAGIEWLETVVENGRFACIVVSHDRYFLENAANRMAELNRAFPGGMLCVDGNYSAFLEKKADYLHAQARRQEALENRLRTEMEWLRRGPKARTTKAKARIGAATEMIAELAGLKARSRVAATAIDFAATDRKTKRLIELEGVSYGFPGRLLCERLDFAVTAGMRVGLVGANGSGKSTFLRLLSGSLAPLEGKVRRAAALRIVHFDQVRHLDPDLTLRRALAPEGDSVIYRDRVIHVNAWAARFLFTGEQLNQPVSRLSGGERARVLIARLMLQPADVLLLDEPTNDLDIPTLEILEDNLLEFSGAMVLVTHDRFMLDRVSNMVLGLDGAGRWGRFASYAQWEEWQEQIRRPPAMPEPSSPPRDSPAAARKKLSYLEAREYEEIERRIAGGEQALADKRALLEDPAVVRDGRRLQEVCREIEEAQRAVDALYARWAELEEKLG